MKQSGDPAAIRSRSALNGQPSDDSTLFSLHSLMKQGAPPPRRVAASSRDESGLIDLAALAAMDQGRATSPKLDVAPFVGVRLFEAPEAAPEPPPQPSARAQVRSPKPWRIALLAGAVIVVAAAPVLAIVLTRSAQDAQLPPVTTLNAVTVPGTMGETPKPPAQPGTTPQPPAQPASPPPAERKAEAPTPAAKPPPSPVKGPSRHGPKPLGSATVTTNPPRPAPACDLMCQMQKSVARPR